MRDDAYTNPATIRATYAARGKNRNLNIAKVESLGVRASQVTPTQAVNVSGGQGGSASGGSIIDPTLQYQGQQTYEGTTYDDTTYQYSKYGEQPIDGSDPTQGIV